MDVNKAVEGRTLLLAVVLFPVWLTPIASLFRGDVLRFRGLKMRTPTVTTTNPKKIKIPTEALSSTLFPPLMVKLYC
jgi:hypothetical protein